jgi:hypothetical protein
MGDLGANLGIFAFTERYEIKDALFTKRIGR